MPDDSKILCISGPNLQLLGKREPAIYGSETLASIHRRMVDRAGQIGARIEARQSNHEGEIVTWICDALGEFDGLVLNPGAYSHTSYAIHDAIKAVGLPCVEVHLSHIDGREEFRRQSHVAPACVGRVSGFGAESYMLGLDGIVGYLRAHEPRG